MNRLVYVNCLGRTSAKCLQKELEYFFHRHDRSQKWHHGDETGKRQYNSRPGLKGKNSHSIDQFIVTAIVGKRRIVGRGKQ